MADPMANPTTGSMTLLQQLEDAGRGEQTGMPDAPDSKARRARGDAGVWRGFAFTIEDLALVVPCANGLQVAPGGEVQPLPLSREWVRGVISVSGEIYTVIDFARFIGRRAVAASRDASLLLMAGEQFNSALLLNSHLSLRAFDNDLPPASAADAVLAPFLSASLLDDNQTWGVLDIMALTNSESFVGIGRDA